MKAILVIDMPECCNNCPCFDGMEDRECCNVLDKDEYFSCIGRDGECPLIPISKDEEVVIIRRKK